MNDTTFATPTAARHLAEIGIDSEEAWDRTPSHVIVGHLAAYAISNGMWEREDYLYWVGSVMRKINTFGQLRYWKEQQS
jgi:hypothetical protein